MERITSVGGEGRGRGRIGRAYELFFVTCN